MLKSTFNIILILLCLSGYGQVNNSRIVSTDSAKDWRPTMVRLSYDLIPLGEGIFTSNRSGHHFQGSVDFYRYFFVVEYGTQKSQRGDGYGYQYENSGSYFRFGPEVNMLKNSVINTLNFGIRYARSSFEDEISFTKVYDTDPPQSFAINESNSDVKAQWAELTAGLNVNVWKGLYMGYTIRYKFWRKISGNDVLTPYDVPGFGLQENRLGVGFNYFIGWEFRFREKVLPPSLIP